MKTTTKQDEELGTSFFRHPQENSKIKGLIVSEYFPQYCQIIMRRHMPARFGYFDMFAGPGIYDDGTWSTPILVAKQCLGKQWLKDRVWLVFNDYLYSDKLRANFDAFIGIDAFPIKPHFGHSKVGSCKAIDDFLIRDYTVGNFNECPSVLFFDPFGYKAINTSLLCQFMKPFGNEMFLFLNTKRITAALFNPKFEKHIRKIFPTTFEETREGWNSRNSDSQKEERLMFLVGQLEKEFRNSLGTVYCSHFRFQESDNVGASHFLIHVTKSIRGCDLVKQIFHSHSNLEPQLSGLGSYTFDSKILQNLLMQAIARNEAEENLRSLKDRITKGLRLYPEGVSASEFYDMDQSQNQYTRAHYLNALRQMEDEGTVEANFTDKIRHFAKVLLSEDCMIKLRDNGNIKD